jgi:hypothetical protein
VMNRARISIQKQIHCIMEQGRLSRAIRRIFQKRVDELLVF